MTWVHWTGMGFMFFLAVIGLITVAEIAIEAHFNRSIGVE